MKVMTKDSILRTRHVLPIVLVLAALASFAPGVEAQVLRTFTRRNPETNARGNIMLVGNTLMTCRQQGNQTACPNGRSGTGSVNNSDWTPIFVDADTDGTTLSSSSATLALPAGSTVLWAGLYWGARSADAGRSQIRFKTAASGVYTTLNATQLDATATATNAYQGFIDVTTQVRSAGSGTYWAAGISADTGQDGTGFYAGWSLVVVYQDNTQPLRNLTVFDGFASVSSGNNVTTTVNGLLTPVAGAFSAFVGTVAYEGDLGISGDSFQITNTSTNLTTTITDTTNPAANFFNSSISRNGTRISAKNPDYVNQLGFDVDTVSVASANTIIGNGANSARLTFNSTQDLYFPGVLTFAVDVYRPQLTGNFSKDVADINGGTVMRDDVLEYTLSLSNTGNDTAANVVLTDPIPAGTTFVPGSLQITSGANMGVKTDGSGDDQAEHDPVLNRAVFRLGTGAGGVSGGNLASGASTVVKFRVKVGVGAGNNSTISNQAGVSYNAATLGTSGSDLSDSDPDVTGDQTTDVTVNVPPQVELVKDSNPRGQQEPGKDLIYIINFSNNSGAASASSLIISDKIPAETEFKIGSATYIAGTTGLAAPIIEYSAQPRNPLSDDAPNPWVNYTPAGAPGTYDSQITYIRFRFTGNLNAGSAGSVAFTVRIR